METGSLVLARLVSYALLLVTAGLPFYAAIRKGGPFTRSQRAGLAVLAMAALAASLWWAVSNVAAMAGIAIGDLDHQTFAAVLGATPLGSVLMVRAVTLAALCGLLALWPRPWALTITALPALASAAWAGHAGAQEGSPGLLLKVGDILHLCGAALWLGALLCFLGAVARKRRGADLLGALSDFAGVGTAVVAMLFVTGLLNVWFISAGELPSGLWPALIAVKIALFLAMLGFAARNRWRLVPELAEERPGAIARLQRSLALETACAFAIVAIVALAGQLDPHGG